MELPDIIGFCLGDAKLVLARNSLETIEVLLTKAPTKKSVLNSYEQSKECRLETDYSDDSRVINAQILEVGKVRLLVCNIENVAVTKDA